MIRIGCIETWRFSLKTRRYFCFLLLAATCFVTPLLKSAEEKFAGGIVYGLKAAFSIKAPEGWVLDNSTGAEQGLPCVLYPKGSTWAEASTIIYAKIASTQFEDVNAFVAIAIKEMKDQHGLPKEKIESGKTRDGRPYFINEYPATERYSQSERVAYVQLPKAVAYIVFSARDEASYRKHATALTEVLKTFVYLEPKSVKPVK